MQAEVKDAYWALFGTEDLKTQPGPRLVELAGHRITEMAGRYAATYPAAMKCLLADRGGLTAYLRFPAEHHHRIRHPDFIERTFARPAAALRSSAGSPARPPASPWSGPCWTGHPAAGAA
jgi:transposase-like protein